LIFHAKEETHPIPDFQQVILSRDCPQGWRRNKITSGFERTPTCSKVPKFYGSIMRPSHHLWVLKWSEDTSATQKLHKHGMA
jgi:hypothetical protein